MFAALPAVFALTNGYARLRPPTLAAELARLLICLARPPGFWPSAYRRNHSRPALYAALARARYVVAAVVLLARPGATGGRCGRAAADLSPLWQ
jgi:hypothetical protein